MNMKTHFFFIYGIKNAFQLQMKIGYARQDILFRLVCIRQRCGEREYKIDGASVCIVEP